MIKLLNKIQQELKVPKNQRNNFGNYNYRSCEDILEAVKPLLEDAVLTINDEIVNIGDRYYVKATAILQTNIKSISATAYAREPIIKKGMDEAQITGATSSYARKYALNGLFAIDDTKDADTMDNKNIVKEPVKQNPVVASVVQNNATQANSSPICSKCGKSITNAEKSFSEGKYNFPLCRECQKTAK